MIKLSSAKKYAKALFEMGLEKDISSKFSDDIKALRELTEKVSEIVPFLANPLVDRETKKEVITKIFSELNIHDYIFNLVFLLIDSNKIKLLPYICKFYQDLEDLYAGRVRGKVIVPDTLSEEYLSAIRDAIKKSLKKEVILTQEIDTDMIGGIIVKVGDMVYDASIKKQLEILKDNILKG